MTLWRLALRSLRFYGRTHLGTLLGATLAAAILTGALAVGDSVRYSLRSLAEQRLGSVNLALASPTRFFRASLAEALQQDLQAPAAAVVQLRGAASRGDGEARAGGVATYGVADDFWKLGPPGANALALGDDTAAISERLAALLKITTGDELVLRVDKPSLLSRDAPLSTIEDATVTMRLRVIAVLEASQFGHFRLEASQVPPASVFLSRAALQKAVGLGAKANLLLLGGGVPAPKATQALWSRWTLADAGLALRRVPGRSELELRTERVFLEPEVAKAALGAYAGARGALTYFVNGIRLGGRETPYSAVAALDAPPVPAGLQEGEMVISSWLAEDLQATPGQSVSLRYWVVGPQRKLEEKEATFKIRAVVPLSGAAADPTLMPDIPGLSDKKDCRDWEPGVPVDLNKIRDKDQAYWSAFKGTPKAFISLPAGQALWNNRFGNLTSVRYPVGAAGQASVEACLAQALNPATLGAYFQPVRERAFAAATAATDFGGLFLAFSAFLIAAALLLAALLFGLSLERRMAEIGTLLALGVPARKARALYLCEGGALALVGSALGAGLATLYTKGILAALVGVWRGAVAGAPLQYHAAPSTIALGAGASFLAALVALLLTLRRLGGAPVRALLTGAFEAAPGTLKSARWPIALLALMGIALALFGAGRTGQEAAGLFFGAGTALLLFGLLACRQLLARLGAGPLTLASLALRQVARRPSRSLTCLALLACGSFLVIAVGASRHDPSGEAARKDSGSGGFALYGESALPIFEDLNAPEGRERFNIAPETLRGVRVIALRVREGDEASCLNLNKAQTPRLLGVVPEAFAGRFGGDWSALENEVEGAIPVIGDTNTVVWALQKKPGDIFPYTDDTGRVHRLKIAGILPNSVLQGALILSEKHFLQLFPGHGGYSVFLMDAPSERADALRATLSKDLEDVGMSLYPTGERLAAFQTVENTYLSVFAALGGLGLLLGSAGLGVIVLRNVQERRSELALLRAVGWERASILRLLVVEHAALLLLGLLIGTLAALVAAIPAMAHRAGVEWGSLFLTVLAIALSGLLWTWLAAASALRAPLLGALQRE